MKALAVSSEKRMPLLPDRPTVAETLTGYEVATWYGVFAPAERSPVRAQSDGVGAFRASGASGSDLWTDAAALPQRSRGPN